MTSFSSAGNSRTSDLRPDSQSAETQASQTQPAETSLLQHQDNHGATARYRTLSRATRDVRSLFFGKRTVTKGDGPAACFYARGKAKVKVCSGRAPPGSWCYHTSARQALPGVPRIRPRTVVTLCYFTDFLGCKMFYFIGVLGTRWESSPVSGRMNLHHSIAVCSHSKRSSVTESNFVWTSDKFREATGVVSPTVCKYRPPR